MTNELTYDKSSHGDQKGPCAYFQEQYNSSNFHLKDVFFFSMI